MSCIVVNSQASLGTQLPPLPATLPTNQAQWQQFLTALQQWGNILKQEQNAPNVLPAIFQIFPISAAAATLAALTAVGCTPSVDPSQQYYGNASLKVAVASAGATLTMTGYPIPIESAQKWFCAFQVYAPSGMTGSLTVKTPGGTTISENFTIPAGIEFQQIYGLFDFSADSDPTATWQFTFNTIANVWIDGMQMSIISDPLINLPAFSATQMIVGPLSSATNLDGIPDGVTYARTLAAYLSSGVPYNFRGAWSSSTPYNKGDEVSSGGNYYLATAANLNFQPPNATYWQLLGPTSLQTIVDGTTRFAQQIYPFPDAGPAGSATWFHLGTLVLSEGSSTSFYWSTGVGFNTNTNQQSTAEVVIRSGNLTAAPNLSGINVLNTGAAAAVVSFKAVATGGSTSPTNASWELYCDCAAFTYGPLEVVLNQTAGDTFTYIGVAASDPGAASSTVVVGNTSSGLNPVLGSGLDALPDGSTYSRTLGAYVVGGVPYTYRGTWASGTAYNIGDEVSFNGSYYIAVAAGTGNAVTNPAFWQLVGTPTQWIATGNCTVNDTNALKQGGSAAWDSSIRSATGYQNCHITAKANGTPEAMMIGLSTTPAASANYTNANFAMYPNGAGGAWAIYEAGSLVLTTSVVASPSDVPLITNDGTNTNYYLNNFASSLRTVSAPGLTLYGFCPFFAPGAGINSLDFGPGITPTVQDTPQIAANAVSQIISATASSASSGNLIATGQDVDLITGSGAFTGAAVGIDFTGTINAFEERASFNSPTEIYITRDGTQVGVALIDIYDYTLNISPAGGGPIFSWSFQGTLTVNDTPAAGVHTYAAHIHAVVGSNAGGITQLGVGLANMALKVREYKK